jgi:hypothetical protein
VVPTCWKFQTKLPSPCGVASSRSKRIWPLSPGFAGPWMCAPVFGVVRFENVNVTTAEASPLSSRSDDTPDADVTRPASGESVAR